MSSEMPIISSPGGGPHGPYGPYFADEDDVLDTIDHSETSTIERQLSEIRDDIQSVQSELQDVHSNLRQVLSGGEESSGGDVTLVVLPERGVRGWLAHMQRKLQGQRTLKDLQKVVMF